MKGGFLLDVVVGQSAAILKLLAGEDEALLVGGNALLVLNLGLDVVDRVGGLDLEGDGLPGNCKAGVSRPFVGGQSKAIRVAAHDGLLMAGLRTTYGS